MNFNGKGEAFGGGSCRRSAKAARSRIRAPSVEGSGGEDMEVWEVREKLMVHLRGAADRMNLVAPPLATTIPPPVVEADREAEVEEGPSSSAAAVVAPAWKLRTRRRGSRARAGSERASSGSLPLAAEKRAVRLRLEDMERPKFSITLTREEIEEDIYSVTGARARRRPRKRPRIVQKLLDSLFPGSWLSEITVDSYKVPE